MRTLKSAFAAASILLLPVAVQATEYRVTIINTTEWEVAKIDVLRGDEVVTSPPCPNDRCEFTAIMDGDRCFSNTRIDFTNGKHIFFKPLNVCDPSPTFIAWPR